MGRPGAPTLARLASTSAHGIGLEARLIFGALDQIRAEQEEPTRRRVQPLHVGLRLGRSPLPSPLVIPDRTDPPRDPTHPPPPDAPHPHRQWHGPWVDWPPRFGFCGPWSRTLLGPLAGPLISNWIEEAVGGGGGGGGIEYARIDPHSATWSREPT